MATLQDVAGAAEALAQKQAGIFLKKNPKASKQEIYLKAFLAGMTTGVEMLAYAENRKERNMIEKVENPLNLNLDAIEVLILELQKQFDLFSADVPDKLSLDETGVSIEIEMTSGTYSYNLQQLKQLKAEMDNPLHQSLKEVS